MRHVYSCCNAHHKRYEKENWFWGLWIDVDDPHQNQPPGEPSRSGYAESKREARNAVMKLVRDLLPARVSHQFSWSYNYLFDLSEKDTRPLFSRCRVSKNKWLWVVYSDLPFDGGTELELARGYSPTPEIAQDDAIAAVGDVVREGNWLAEGVRKREAAERRKTRVSSSTDTAQIEFVYRTEYSDYDSNLRFSQHRILKKTARRIYVECGSFIEGNVPLNESTFILDRESFENDGEAWSRSMGDFFYADPAVFYEKYQANRPRHSSLENLGVPADATVDEIRQAYRNLAKSAHPDAGGDPDDFKQLRSWYEEAIAIREQCA